MFNNLKVGKKLFLMASCGLAVLLIVGISGFVIINKISTKTNTLALEQLPSIDMMKEFKASMFHEVTCIRTLLTRRITGEIRESQYGGIAKDMKTCDDIAVKIKKLSNGADELAAADKLLTSLDGWKNNLNTLVELHHQRDQISSNASATAKARIEELDKKIFDLTLENRIQYKNVETIINAITEKEMKSGDQLIKETETLVVAGKVFILILLFIGFVSVMLIGISVSRSISVPVNQLAWAAGEIANRNRGVKIEYHADNELGKMADSLRALIDQLYMYEVSFDAYPLPISITDKNMNWIFFNRAAEKASKQKREEMIGKPCSNWGTEFCGTSDCIIERLKRGENSAIHHDKENDRFSLVQPAYIHNAEGEHVGFIEIFSDVTKQHHVTDFLVKEVDHLAANLKCLSHGDLNFTPQVGKSNQYTTEEHKSFEVINNNLQIAVNAIRNLAKDAAMLASAGQEGRLDARADASIHSGAYKDIVTGVNNFIEAVAAPTDEVIAVMNEVAQGDLTGRINGNYKGKFAKLKDNLNASLESLDSTIGQVTEAVQQVNSGGQQIADASQSLSQGATEQAASLEQISSSMNQIGAQITHNAESAGTASRLSIESRTAAETGARNMDKMVEAMRDINASSQQIAKINKVIDDIAFQTNLLALNAAVEAARAGIHGKGFAVVADEVRNLAGRSAKAAHETSEMIDDSTRKVENGLVVAESASEAFKQIVDGIIKVADIASEIAVASNEQAQGIGQINQGLNQIDQVTQQNTAHAEETAAAAEELSGQSGHLLSLTRQFKVKEQG